MNASFQQSQSVVMLYFTTYCYQNAVILLAVFYHSSKQLLFSSGPPSAPRNAISNVNETSVFLEWSVPMETGGRKDVRYNILCRQVLPDNRGLEECGPNVRFLPRRIGLSNTSVMVADLQSHTNYSFLLEAINGVSELAKDYAKQYVTLNVTTNQAGMLHCSFIVFFFFHLKKCLDLNGNIALLKFLKSIICHVMLNCH